MTTSPAAPPRARGPLLRHPGLQVAGLVVLLEVLAYWAWFAGLTVPHGDFLAGYLTEARAWWSRGGPLAPPGWLDYAWMGYPSEASLQNSSYYLPVGLATLLGGYTPWTAAVLAALHTGFGAVGAYVLGRRLGIGHTGALLALVGWFFAPGFFANAQHVDISRGFAWAPWVLLVASPLWRWDRRWGIPLAALLVWQYLCGTYPGMLAVAAYCLPAWVLAWVARRDAPRAWLGRLAVAGAAGVLAATAKLGAALALSAGATAATVQEAGLPPALVPTTVLPYGSDALPYDVSMRPFFVVAPLLVLLPWARRGRWTVPLVVTGAVALVLVVGGQVAEPLLRALPGLDLSRFRANDAKPFLLLPLVLLGASGLAAVRDPGTPRRRIRLLGSAVPLVLAVVAAALQAPWRTGPLGAAGTAGALVVLGGSLVLVAVLPGRPRRPAGVSVLLVLGLATVSGLGWAYSTPGPWQRMRVEVERATYGSTARDLLARDCTTPQQRRPARIATPADELTTSTVALRGAFSCESAVGGYLNIKTFETMPRQLAALVDPATGPDVLAFYAAPGAVVPVVAGRAADLRSACLDDGDCAGLRFAPREYRPGSITYDVEVSRAGPVALNESYYPGWQAQACTATSCTRVETVRGPAGSLQVDLVPGVRTLTVTYRTPHGGLWRGVLLAGLLLGLAGAALPPRRQQRSPSFGRVPSTYQASTASSTQPLDRV